MKKKSIFLLIALMMVFAVPVCHAGTVNGFDYDAFREFAATWNRGMEEIGLPFTLDAKDDENGCWAHYLSDINRPTTVMDSLSNPDVPLNLLLAYIPDITTFLLYYGEQDLTEAPIALSFYVDGVKHESHVQYDPAETTDDVSLYAIAIPLETAEEIRYAEECFLRLTTDKDVYFQDINENATPVPLMMLQVLHNGLLYSYVDCEYYRDTSLLWKTEESNQPSVTPAPEKNISFQNDYEAIDRAAQSVFLLEVYNEKAQMIATGSGFLAFDSSTLVTNEHVIEDAAYIIAHSDKYAASYKLTEVKAADAEKDIALLVFDASARIKPLDVDLHSRILRGQPVTAIGSPKGVINTVSSGNISNVIYHSESIPEYIQFTAPISPGSSGGALFNEAGAVIGLCVSYLKEGEAMYYAIPMKYVEEMYQSSRKQQPLALAQYNSLPTDLAAPVLSKPKTLKNGIELAWSSANYAEAYEVYRSTDRKTGFSRIATVQKESYIDTQVEMGELYWYQIRVYNSWKGLSDASNTRSGMLPVPTATPTPQPTPIPAGEALYSFGDVDDEILSIKLRLYELGYLYASRNFDNYYDQILQSTVVSFQARNKFAQTGEIDKKTLAAINSPNAVKGPFGVPNAVKALSKQTYQLGDESSAVAEIKKQLQVMGYYKSSASFDNKYNKMMAERVQEFQKNNNLEETGIVDYVTLIKLFYSEAEKGAWYVAPTPTPKPEKSITLEFVEDAPASYQSLSNDRMKIRFKVKNTSSRRTIVAYELYVYTVDKKGQRMTLHGKDHVLSVKATLKPGQEKYTSYITLEPESQIKDIYAAVHQVKYSDGTVHTAASHNYNGWGE